MFDSNLAINVTITGITLVFAMLLLLVFILYVFGFISKVVTKSKDKKSAKINAETLAAMKNDVDEPVESGSNDELSDEIVAVIAAAVNSLYSGTNKRPVIKTIKKASARRSAWGNAGIIQNTRSF